MSLTVTVKDELALVVTENAAQRRAEVSAMLRFAGGLHIVSGRIVVEAELDHGGAVRRLHQHLKELYGMEPEVMVVQGGSLHRGSRYVLRVTQRGKDLARLRALAASLGVREIVAQGRSVRFAPVDPPESGRMRLTRLYPGTVLKPATRTIVVPAPGSARMGGGAVEGEELLRWAEVLLRAVVVGDKDYEAEATRYRRRR